MLLSAKGMNVCYRKALEELQNSAGDKQAGRGLRGICIIDLRGQTGGRGVLAQENGLSGVGIP